MLKFLADAGGYVVGTLMFVFLVLGFIALSPLLITGWLFALLFAKIAAKLKPDA